MAILNCDFDEDGKLFKAFQALILEVSELQKRAKAYKQEQDYLKGTVAELQSILSRSSTNSPEKDGRRKRTKISTPPNDASVCSLQDVTNDDLNAAFNSSSCFDDEDSIVGTQVETKQTNRRKSSDKENNLNFRLMSISHIDKKSPTILIRYPMKTDSKLVTPEKLSSPARRSGSKGSSAIKTNAAKKGTPRRLFELCSPSTSKKSPTPPQTKTNIVPKRKYSNLSLSSNTNTTRMKQSTINFPPKQIDETFFESVTTQRNNENKSGESSTINIKSEKHEPGNVPLHPLNSIEEDDISSSFRDNSVIEVKKDANEIININESESSQEFYDHVDDIKRELDLPTQFDESDNIALKSVGSTRTSSTETPSGCHDCNMYHKMLGRDARNPVAKRGVCSKHYRKMVCLETPPDFWNPKIVDTPKDEHLATPFDTR